MVSKMGKNGMLKGNEAAMTQQMSRNPNAMMQQLSRSIDPRMLEQFGGVQNMMSMLKGMGKEVSPKKSAFCYLFCSLVGLSSLVCPLLY
jgi:hypothetical protein